MPPNLTSYVWVTRIVGEMAFLKLRKKLVDRLRVPSPESVP
jgi:hypothetical protein